MPVSAQYLIISILMYCGDSMLSSVLSQSHIIHVCDALQCVCCKQPPMHASIAISSSYTYVFVLQGLTMQ